MQELVLEGAVIHRCL